MNYEKFLEQYNNAVSEVPIRYAKNERELNLIMKEFNLRNTNSLCSLGNNAYILEDDLPKLKQISKLEDFKTKALKEDEEFMEGFFRELFSDPQRIPTEKEIYECLEISKSDFRHNKKLKNAYEKISDEFGVSTTLKTKTIFILIIINIFINVGFYFLQYLFGYSFEPKIPKWIELLFSPIFEYWF